MSRSDVIDHLCGEGTPEERAAFRQDLARDLELAVEVAETGALFDRFRELTCEPTGRVAVVVRRAVLRRLELRHPELDRLGSFATAWRVAAVALVWLGVSWFLFRHIPALQTERIESVAAADVVAEPQLPRTTADALRRPATVATGSATPDPELEQLLDRDYVPVDAPAFRESLARIDDTAVGDRFSCWLSAENRLARLRQEYDLRYSEEARARARRALGTPDLDDRIAALAAEIAPRLQPAKDLDIEDLSYGVRALLAAGSTLDAGSHHETVRECTEELARRVPLLRDGDLAVALAALSDVAVVEGGSYADLVGRHADRLARETLRRDPQGPRPALLHWTTPASRIADAGRVLQLAPSFGTNAGLALRARTMLAAHLGERIASRSEAESPTIVAAWLYGFGDLIDRDDADRRLALWRGGMLLPEYIAMQQLAWSKYPVRRGWAEFQLELLRFAGLPTPPRTADAAALLLALSTNVAAPGVLDGLQLADL